MSINLFSKNKNKQSGYMLAEAVISIGMISIGLLGVFGLLSKTLSLNRTVSNRFIATNLAIEGVEIVRNIVDTKFFSGEDWGANLPGSEYAQGIDYTMTNFDNAVDPSQNLKIDSSTGVYSYVGDIESPFRREVYVKINSWNDGLYNDEIQVNSIVYWRDSRTGDNSINIEDHFFNYRILQ